MGKGDPYRGFEEPHARGGGESESLIQDRADVFEAVARVAGQARYGCTQGGQRLDAWLWRRQGARAVNCHTQFGNDVVGAVQDADAAVT
jgi:hypothetical protein